MNLPLNSLRYIINIFIISAIYMYNNFIHLKCYENMENKIYYMTANRQKMEKRSSDFKLFYNTYNRKLMLTRKLHKCTHGFLIKASLHFENFSVAIMIRLPLRIFPFANYNEYPPTAYNSFNSHRLL